jgi:hypothetical protein
LTAELVTSTVHRNSYNKKKEEEEEDEDRKKFKESRKKVNV